MHGACTGRRSALGTTNSILVALLLITSWCNVVHSQDEAIKSSEKEPISIISENIDEEQIPDNVCTEHLLLKHIAASILETTKLDENSSEHLLFHLSLNAKKVLASWSQGHDTYSAVDVADVIKDSFFSYSDENADGIDQDPAFNIQDYLEQFQSILLIATFLLILAYFTAYFPFNWRSLVLRVLLITFVVSIPWNWLLLYKKAVAKKQAQLIERVSEDCREQKITFTMWVSSIFAIQTQTPCQKYHEALLVDPLWEIAPTQAISETIVRLVLQPAEQLGQGMSLCLRSLLGELPPHLWPVALFFLFCLVSFLLIVTFRYSVRLPLLGGIEPAGNYSLKNCEAKIQSLELKLEKINSRSLMHEQMMALNSNSAAGVNGRDEDCALCHQKETTSYNAKNGSIQIVKKEE